MSDKPYWQEARVGVRVVCATCGRMKKPIGRSAAPEMANGLCDDDACLGYLQPPLAGSLWPGETSDEFGYPVSEDGSVLLQPVASPPAAPLSVEQLRWNIICSNGDPTQNADALIQAVTVQVEQRLKNEQKNDQGAALLPGDALASPPTTEPLPRRKYRSVVEYDFDESRCENCDEPTSEVFVTSDDVRLCRECWTDVPVERRFTVVGSAPPAAQAQEDWEPSGKCQLDTCDGTKFDYDSGDDPRYGAWYCLRCYGAQFPPSALTPRAGTVQPEQGPIAPSASAAQASSNNLISVSPTVEELKADLHCAIEDYAVHYLQPNAHHECLRLMLSAIAAYAAAIRAEEQERVKAERDTLSADLQRLQGEREQLKVLRRN